MFTMHPVSIACTCVLAVLLFGLAILISGQRLRTRALIGVTQDPDALLNRLVRAHGNTAEYAPMLVVLFVILGARQPSTATLALMVAATVARVLFVIGMLVAPSLTRPNPIRFVGALGTYVAGLWLVYNLATGA